MKRIIILIACLTAVVSIATADHNCPDGGTQKAWVICMNGYEFDEDGVWLTAATECFISQGYPMTLGNGYFSNFQGPQQFSCQWKLDENMDYQVCQGNSATECLTIYGHGNTDHQSQEIYSYDLEGEGTRDDRWDHLKYWYHPGPYDPEIVKTTHTDPDPNLAYYGIALTAHGLKELCLLRRICG